MPTTPLGKSGLDITPVGFGAWAIGGGDWAFGWGGQDDADSIAAIHHAVTGGVNWIDTAAAYGLGHSEEVVGKALAALPAADRPLVFTKCGVLADPTNPMGELTFSLEPQSIRAECEASLRRLGVDAIDLYQIHWPDRIGTPIEQSWAVMDELRQAGKIRAAGVSNFTVGQLVACESVAHVDSLQPPFSLIHREAAADLLPWCEENGTGVISYSPMQSGLLTGAFTVERVAALDAGDWRRASEDFIEPNLGRNLQLAAALQPIADKYGVAPGAVAVAWVLSWPQISGAIVGARRPAQVAGWLPAATLSLDANDHEALVAALDLSSAGSGPLGPAMP